MGSKPESVDPQTQDFSCDPVREGWPEGLLFPLPTLAVPAHCVILVLYPVLESHTGQGVGAEAGGLQ